MREMIKGQSQTEGASKSPGDPFWGRPWHLKMIRRVWVKVTKSHWG